MDRKNELLEIFKDIEGGKEIISPLIGDVIFLEEKLKNLKKMPFIRVNPKNPAEQKATAAARQYKEFLQQYNNCIKILCSALCKNAQNEEESPLRMFFEGLVKDEE